jgi:hypothetical protein
MKECIYIRHIHLVWLGEKSATTEILLGYCLVYDQLGGYDVHKTVPTFSMPSIWRKKFYSFRMYYKAWTNFCYCGTTKLLTLQDTTFAHIFNP